MKKIKIITSIVSTFFISLSILGFVQPLESFAAGETRTIVVDAGELNVTLPYENKGWVDFASSPYASKYPSTYSYKKDGFAGTLTAKRIKLEPLNKVDVMGPARFVTLNEIVTKEIIGTMLPTFPAFQSSNYTDDKTGITKSYILPPDGNYKFIEEGREPGSILADGSVDLYDKFTNHYYGIMGNNPTYTFDTWNSGPNKGQQIPWNVKLPAEQWRPVVRIYGLMPEEAFTVKGLLSTANGGYYWADSEVWSVAMVQAEFTAANKANGKHARTWKDMLVQNFGQYYFRSENGNLNKYRRGIYLNYEIEYISSVYERPYKTTVKLPDYVASSNATKWKVSIEYSGDVDDKRADNFYMDSVKVTPTSVNLIGDETERTQEITVNYTVKHFKDPATNNIQLSPEIVIKNGGIILWEGNVPINPNGSTNRSVTIESTLKNGNNQISVEVNPNRKMVEYKESGADAYTDNKAVAIAAVGKYVVCNLPNATKVREENTWSEKWTVYKQSGTVGSTDGQSHANVISSSAVETVMSYKEQYKIETLYFRSKYTKDLSFNDLPSQGKGWMKITEGSVARIKAGYGFELRVETSYATNRNVKASYTESAANPYSSLKYGTGFASFETATPSVTPVNSPNLLYLNMKANALGKTVCYILENTLTSGTWNNDNKLFEVAMKDSLGKGVEERKIYTNAASRTGVFEVSVSTPKPGLPNSFMGYEAEEPVTMTDKNYLHDIVNFFIEVLGQDDIKSHIIQ